MKLGKKIIVIGCCGSGKSTLSMKLHDITGIPLIHLDNIWWKQDRTHISRDEFDQKLNEIFQDDSWILDGDYSRTYEVRIKACDTVIFLDYDLNECMRGIYERIGKNRPDIPWTEHKIDPYLINEVENDLFYYIEIFYNRKRSTHMGIGTHYKNTFQSNKRHAMKMSMTLKYNGKEIINYTARTWWLTGFNPKYLNKKASSLSVSFTVYFNNIGMFNAFSNSRDGKAWTFNRHNLSASYTF